MNLRIHHFLPYSRANGPGTRAVIWVQGCTLGCPGCFNPETHSLDGGETADVDDLFQRIITLGDSIEGITISGGEPLQQRPAVSELLRRVKSETTLSVILFTGFAWEEVMRMCRSEGRKGERAKGRVGEITHCCDSPFRRFPDSPIPRLAVTPSPANFLNYVDVLIAGRYNQNQRLARGLRGSANKTVHLLTSRYTARELESVPSAEVVVAPDGELLLSGIEPLSW